MWGHHTRQPVIIRLLAGLNCLLAVTAALPAEAQQPSALGPTACVSCVILHVPAVTVSNLDLESGALRGLIVVTDGGAAESGSTLDRLVAAGVVPGLLLSPTDPAPPLDVLRRAAVLVVRAHAGDESAVFALRSLAAAARDVRPDVRVLQEGPIAEAVRAYVDGSVEPEESFDSVTLDQLVALSRVGEGRRLIAVEAVDWRVIAAFAAMRPLSSEVVGSATLTADEVVARHQAQRARQDRLVHRTIATGSTTLLFNVPGFVAPVTITAGTVIYRRPGLTEIEQIDIRVNGAAIAGGDAASPPKLPLIEAERVSTPPLVIALGDAYRYTLDGRERIDGRDVYVIGFAPRERMPESARGRAWIDATSFALRRLESVQDRLRGPIVSSEQHDRFARFYAGDNEIWLPVQTNVFQTYEGAGHRTPVHRTISTPQYEINPESFEARLEAAHASSHLMLRETPEGLRYLLRGSRGADGGPRRVAPRAGERIRAAVAGVLVDPNISVPLPFAGFSYVDLNLFNTGAQLNAFVGGTYGQLSWSLPSIGRSNWQAHGRAFVIAARYNDRAFRGGIEQYHENITQRPLHISAGLARPVFDQTRVRLDYELDYTNFGRADTTAARFVVPADTVVHGLMSVLETERGPWSFRAWWNPAIRQNWRAWGESSESVEASRTFTRYGTLVARTLALGRVVAARVEGAWMAGRDLDRFSRYTFDAFENRLHGYPTASLRYDHGAVVRTVTSWSARGWRVDAFGDAAFVRDPGFDHEVKGYPGVGAAVEMAGPLRTLWSVEWGYGFRARRDDGGLGTQAVRITVFRVF
jgi:hypothetical protein